MSLLRLGSEKLTITPSPQHSIQVLYSSSSSPSQPPAHHSHFLLCQKSDHAKHWLLRTYHALSNLHTKPSPPGTSFSPSLPPSPYTLMSSLHSRPKPVYWVLLHIASMCPGPAMMQGPTCLSVSEQNFLKARTAFLFPTASTSSPLVRCCELFRCAKLKAGPLHYPSFFLNWLPGSLEWESQLFSYARGSLKTTASKQLPVTCLFARTFHTFSGIFTATLQWSQVIVPVL